MSNKLYDILKWVSLVFLDAAGVAYEELSNVWNLPYGTEIMKTCTIFSIFIGTLIGVSSIRYAKKIKQEQEQKKEQEAPKPEEEVG